ncbi:MAG: hypothetical protein NC110_04135, partial [Ruminococcus sp.]|nr:hypothetical protein [Ruminococcus sp.]
KDLYQNTVVTVGMDKYLEAKDSVADIKVDDALSVQYSVYTKRIDYTTRGGFLNLTTYHHYHNALTNAATQSVTVLTNTKDAYDKLNAHKSSVDSVSAFFGDDFETALGNVNDGVVTQESYNAFATEYNSMVAYLSNSVDMYKKFFGDGASTFIDTYRAALNAATYLGYGNEWKVFADAHPEYASFNFDAAKENAETVRADYAAFTAIYNAVMSGGDEIVEYLVKNGTIDLAYADTFAQNIKALDLANTKAAADAIFEKYPNEEISEEEKTVDASMLGGYISAINGYEKAVVDAVFPDGYDYLKDLQLELSIETNDYVAFFAQALGTSFVDTATEEIENYLDNTIPGNLDGLNAFYADLKTTVGEEKAEAVLGGFMTSVDAFVESLYDLLAKRFEAQFAVVSSAYEKAGSPTEIDVKSYLALKPVFAAFDGSIYTYLEANDKVDMINADVVAQYKMLLDKFYSKFADYDATKGLIGFETTELDYASRDVYTNDKIKTEKYDVTEEKLLDTIEKLDSFLTGEQFESLAGINLKETLTGVLDNIYTDDIVNTIVSLLYPLVGTEFAKVWAGLPATVPVKDPISTTITLSLYGLEEAMAAVNLNLFPTTLGAAIKDKYPEVAALLKQATTKATYNLETNEYTDPWKDSAICDENGKLALEWGVTDKDSFVDAVSTALSGLEPLLMALVCNQEMALSNKIGTGTGKAFVVFTITVDPVTLKLNASANSGYNNLLAPIFEALGMTAPDGDKFANLAEFVELGILNPVEELLAKIAEAPVDFVLSALPNLLYALSTDTVTPLLGMLKTNISYNADASYNAVGGLAAGTVKDALTDAKPVAINVGDMLNLKDMGIDLSKGLQGILDLVGIQLPEIDALTVMTLGSLKEIDTVRNDYIYNKDLLGVADGKALTIEADKADVAYYILTYVVDLLKDEASLKGLLSAFVKDEAQIDSIVSTIASLGLKSTGDVVAALIELINAEKYPQSTFAWPEMPVAEEPTEGEEAAEDTEDTFYTMWWQKEHAEYVSENLVSFVTNLANLLGYDISEVLTDFLATLYTKENLVKLVDLVNGLLAQVDENETIKSIIDIIDPLVNINVKDTLAALAGYQVPDFEDGDRDAFVNALVDYIKPIVPVLKLLLVDSADNSEIVIADAIEIFGYNGYDNALIPILEAIGCKSVNITKYADFVKLDDEAMVKAVLNPILALIDEISADPINVIISLLPNILYFVDFGGLQMAIDNILEPVYVVLDVVRPVYNIDLTVNLSLDEIITDLLAKADIKSIGYSDISTVVKSLGTVTEYKSANGSTATSLVVEESLTPEFITVLLRMVISTVIFSDNVDKVVEYIKTNNERLTDAQVETVSKTLHALAEIAVPDQILRVLYYIFFGLNTGVAESLDLKIFVTGAIEEAIAMFADSDVKKYVDAAMEILKALNGSANPEDPDAPVTPDNCSHICHKDGFMGLIYKIMRLFWKIFGTNKTCVCGVDHY